MNDQIKPLTLRHVALARKARKGPATKITKDGAYWDAIRVKIGNSGGDGIGQSSANVDTYLIVRHYRSGELRAYCERRAWHQNYATNVVRVRCDQVLDLTTIEDLVVTLRGLEFAPDYGVNMPVEVSDFGIDRLVADLEALPASIPAPDEV